MLPLPTIHGTTPLWRWPLVFQHGTRLGLWKCVACSKQHGLEKVVASSARLSPLFGTHPPTGAAATPPLWLLVCAHMALKAHTWHTHMAPTTPWPGAAGWQRQLQPPGARARCRQHTTCSHTQQAQSPLLPFHGRRVHTLHSHIPGFGEQSSTFAHKTRGQQHRADSTACRGQQPPWAPGSISHRALASRRSYKLQLHTPRATTAGQDPVTCCKVEQLMGHFLHACQGTYCSL